ncbi:MAG: DUF86 domain-containing protein [Candidatus Aenigmatarchaeota archaeon]
MIDKDLIEAKFDIIEENLKFLEGYKEKKLKEYRDIQAVKYSLFEITEACIDIANHIIAASGFERVEEYSKMFTILKKNKIISESLEKKLMEMAKFRNFLVHRYAEVKVEYLEKIIRENLIDIKMFIKEIKNYIK